MENIKDYIQFAIDNGFGKYEKYLYKNMTDEEFIYTITSKPFIEAIAKGIRKNWYTELAFWNLEDDVTTGQAIHIREWTLDLFITNLLK